MAKSLAQLRREAAGEEPEEEGVEEVAPESDSNSVADFLSEGLSAVSSVFGKTIVEPRVRTAQQTGVALGAASRPLKTSLNVAFGEGSDASDIIPSILDPSRAATAEQVKENVFGIPKLGERDKGLEITDPGELIRDTIDFGGTFLIDVFTDPLTAVAGVGSLSKAGNVLKAAGGMATQAMLKKGAGQANIKLGLEVLEAQLRKELPKAMGKKNTQAIESIIDKARKRFAEGSGEVLERGMARQIAAGQRDILKFGIPFTRMETGFNGGTHPRIQNMFNWTGDKLKNTPQNVSQQLFLSESTGSRAIDALQATASGRATLDMLDIRDFAQASPEELMKLSAKTAGKLPDDRFQALVVDLVGANHAQDDVLSLSKHGLKGDDTFSKTVMARAEKEMAEAGMGPEEVQAVQEYAHRLYQMEKRISEEAVKGATGAKTLRERGDALITAEGDRLRSILSKDKFGKQLLAKDRPIGDIINDLDKNWVASNSKTREAVRNIRELENVISATPVGGIANISDNAFLHLRKVINRGNEFKSIDQAREFLMDLTGTVKTKEDLMRAISQWKSQKELPGGAVVRDIKSFVKMDDFRVDGSAKGSLKNLSNRISNKARTLSDANFKRGFAQGFVHTEKTHPQMKLLSDVLPDEGLEKIVGGNPDKLWVHPDVASAFKRRREVYTDPVQLKGVASFAAKYSQLWKSITLSRPATFMRDVMGTGLNRAAGGGFDSKSLTELPDLLRLSRHANKSINSEGGRIIKDLTFDVGNGQTVTGEQLLRKARQLDFLDSGYWNFEFGKDILEGAVARQGVGKKVARKVGEIAKGELQRKAASHQENIQKLGMFLARLRAGDTPIDAAFTVQKYTFDYRRVAPAFQLMRKTGFSPFISWASKNIPLQMELLFTRPRLWTALTAAKNALDDPTIPDINKPEIARKEYGVTLRTGKSGELEFVFGKNFLPMADIAKFAEGDVGGFIADVFQEQLGPIPQGVMGAITNVDPFTGRNFREIEKVAAGPLPITANVPGRAAALLNPMIPLSNAGLGVSDAMNDPEKDVGEAVWKKFFRPISRFEFETKKAKDINRMLYNRRIQAAKREMKKALKKKNVDDAQMWRKKAEELKRELRALEFSKRRR